MREEEEQDLKLENEQAKQRIVDFNPLAFVKLTPVRVHCPLVRATSTSTRNVFYNDATLYSVISL